MSKKIYIVVLNWNGTHDTIECLKSLREVEYDNYQLILVDNNSEKQNLDELANWCRTEFSSVCTYSQQEAIAGGNRITESQLSEVNSSESLLIIENEGNLGFAAGNNVAVEYVLTKDKDAYTLLLNNDTVADACFLSRLSAFMDENPDYVACTPQIRLYEPNDVIWNCGGRIVMGNRRYFYNGQNIDKVPQQGTQDITFVTGCALFFKPHITGMLTDRFFFGEEDFEFSLRLRQQKMKMACVFDALIYHKVSGSIKSTNNKSFNRFFLHYASRLINIKSFYSSFNYFFIKRFNLAFAFVLLYFRYKQSFTFSCQLIGKLTKYSSKHSDLRVDAFTKIMNGEY